MAKWDSDSGGSIPKPSELCNVDGCNEKTIVQFVCVNYNGRKVTGAFSEYGRKTGDKLALNDGIIFRGWITRCAAHYQRDMDRRVRK